MSESKMREGNISLVLDSYDDIFSDFDPRPYDIRAISGDFLQECRNASRDKDSSGIELRLLVPKSKRSTRSEGLIRKRLKNHFHKHFLMKRKEIVDRRHKGFAWVLAGVAFSLLATSLDLALGFSSKLVFVIAEPAGWFSIWTGFDHIVLLPKEMKTELEFYRKMSNADIVFANY